MTPCVLFVLAVIGYLYDRGENKWRVGHRWVLWYLYLGLKLANMERELQLKCPTTI